MAAVLLTKHKENYETLFEGTYEECEEFFNKQLEKEREERGPELYIRSYPSSHKSIEAVWMMARLVLKNWSDGWYQLFLKQKGEGETCDA